MIDRPGPDGEPLPTGVRVLRLHVPPKDFRETGRVLPNALELSSQEKRDDPPRLSVFAEDLTTTQQAAKIVTNPHHNVVIYLKVDEVRGLRRIPDSKEIALLDVVWHHIDSTEPGAEGHAGIAGLYPPNRVIRKTYRLLLTEIAETVPLERELEG